jgi:hypothetical protein
MSIHATFDHLKTLNQADVTEYLVSKVNVGDLQMLEGFAELEDNNQLAYIIWNIRCAPERFAA